MLKVKENIYYVGASDRHLDLFESHFIVPNGMAYNSYIILDEKIAVMDSIDEKLGDEWLKNVKEVLGGRRPDYLVIHHMEPDHSANIFKLVEEYPDITLIGGEMTFNMLANFHRG